MICLLWCGFLFAQSQPVTMPQGKTTLSQVFRQVESQTGMSVDYDAKEVNLSQVVTVPSGVSTVKGLLDATLPGAGYSYTINKMHIVVSAREVVRTKTITGTVVDANGEPVMGVGIFVKGNSNGTVTDTDGSYSIEADGSATLVFTSLGYKEVEVAVGKRSVVNVTLEEDTLFLEDAVVVGYGVQKKENLTGAVSVVDAESIGKRSNASLGGILQGTVPGLTVTTSSGRPDESASLNIRGWNSINSGSPLVLVDGVVGSLERVNPNDVESISVLKDASSAAVYGAKAAFGVVLVTTKSGGDKDGRGTIHYSGRWGFSSPTTSTDWETRGYDLVYTINKFGMAFNGKKQILYDDADMAELWVRRNDVTENPERPWVVLDEANRGYKYYANTDWWHIFFNDVKPTQNHDISFRGGTKTIKYFLSGNFNKEQGVFRINPDVYRKYNLRARVSFDVKPWLNVSENAAFYSANYTYPGISDMNDAMYKCSAGYFAYLLPQSPEGYYLYKDNYGGGGQTILGNLANEHFVNRNRTNNFTNTVEVTIKPVQQLEIKGNYSYSLNSYYQMNRSVNGTFAAPQRLKTVSQTTGDNEDKLVENTQSTDLHSVNLFATFADTFADAHNLKVMAGGPLFGTVCGSIRNLTVEDAKIEATADDAAVVVGVAGSSETEEDFVMKNVTVKKSSVSSDYKRAGALIAHLRNGVVENCVAECPVYAQQQAGGLIGRVDAGTLTGCSATGNATAEAYYIGGLVGYAGNVTVKGCSATGDVSSLGGNYSRAGGLIGQIEGNATLEKCHATGNVEGQGHMAGGLVGIIGETEGYTVSISKCYATGSVTLPHGESGNWSHAGGLLGTISSLNTELSISDCYSTGAILSRRYSGGFVGSVYNKAKACKSLTIKNSYCSSDLSGIVVADRCGIALGLNDGAQATVPTVITCTGFVAWNVSERPFSYNDAISTDGNYYGSEGTISAQAKALGWDENIWDLSGNEPKLK